MEFVHCEYPWLGLVAFFSPSTLRTKKDSVALLTETQVEMEHSVDRIYIYYLQC